MAVITQAKFPVQCWVSNAAPLSELTCAVDKVLCEPNAVGGVRLWAAFSGYLWSDL
jgi:hypothetical protein